MPKKKDEQAKGISWKTVFGILGSIAVLVGSIVSGLDFINYLREGYQQFLWLGVAVLSVIWFIILWLLFKRRNIYWMLYLMVTVVAGVVVWNGWHSYIQARESKLIVLIARFDGPEEIYGLRNEILEKLNQDFVNDVEVEIESINEIVTPDSGSGSLRARELGEKLQADIVIWGWYRPTENPNSTIHVSNLSPNEFRIGEFSMIKESEIYKPDSSRSDLESFRLQEQLGSETTNLIHFLIGNIHFKQQDYRLALSRFEKTLINNQDHLVIEKKYVYLLSGICHDNIGEYDTAIRYYQLALQEDPYLEKAYNNLGVTYRTIGDYEEALENFSQALTIKPDYSLAYRNRGETYQKMGQYQSAFADINESIRISPDGGKGYLSLGNLYSDLEQYELAISQLDKAIELNPEFTKAYNNRGYYYQKLELYESAIKDFDKAISIDENYVLAYMNRGNTYFHMGDFVHAISDYEQINRIAPENAMAYNNRGAAYSELSDFESAKSNYDRAIELDQEFAIAYQGRGKSYFQLGDSDHALIDLDRAIQINPELASAYYYRGLVYQDIGLIAEAEADFKTYEELRGENP